jgi:hypothetical protein
MKTLALLSLISLCAAAAAGPGDVESLAAEARALPPEFAADALLRLAGVDSVAPARRLALLDDAFRRAGQAQQTYKLRSAMMGMPAPVAFLQKVNQQDLDGLDLEVRAVEAMLPLDAARARKLFQSIPPIRLEPLKCDDSMVYDLDRFYQAMAAAARTFTDAEKQAGETLRFLRPFAAVRAPSQVGPMAAAIAGSGLNDGDFTTLVNAFAASLGKIAGDDRSFSAAYVAGARIESLAEECKRRKISPLPLLEAYRLYLVTHLSGARCADDDRMQGGMVMASSAAALEAYQAVDFAGFFNQKLRTDPLQPIQEAEATPARLEGAVTGLRTCEDEDCQAISTAFRGLVLTSQGTTVPPADRASKDWRDRHAALLQKLEAWKPGEHTTPAEHFREKVLLYSDLLSISPAGEPRDGAVRSEISYLLHSREEAATRMEWFLPLNALLARTSLDPVGYGAYRAELEKSADPVAALYAKLEAVAPRPPDRVISLL